MADVKIIDIDNEQWNIKDQEARDKISLLGNTSKIKAIGESYKSPKNNIFRGKCLNGSADVQYPILPFSNSPTLNGGGYSIAQVIEKIANGSFDDIYIGDYIIDQNNRVYRIAGLDTELNKGYIPITAHHVVIVPDFALTNIGWNATNTTANGYQNSAAQIYCDGTGQAIIESVFGAAHILTVRDLMSVGMNASVPSSGYSAWQGIASAWDWSSHKVRLMSEIEVYGAKVWSSGFDIGSANKQFPLFQLAPQLATGMHYSYWLSGIANASSACLTHSDGIAGYFEASTNAGIRPRFILG